MPPKKIYHTGCLTRNSSTNTEFEHKYVVTDTGGVSSKLLEMGNLLTVTFTKLGDNAAIAKKFTCNQFLTGAEISEDHADYQFVLQLLMHVDWEHETMFRNVDLCKSHTVKKGDIVRYSKDNRCYEVISIDYLRDSIRAQYINDHNKTIDFSCIDMNKLSVVDSYWFINSEGKICAACRGDNGRRDWWTEINNNQFDSFDHAKVFLTSKEL